MIFIEKIKEKKIFLILILIISLIAGFVFVELLAPKTYIASSSMMILIKEDVDNQNQKNMGNLVLTDDVYNTINELINSDSVYGKAQKNVLSGNSSIFIYKTPNSNIFKVQVKDYNYDSAIRLLNEIDTIFAIEIKKINDNYEVHIVDSPKIVDETLNEKSFKYMMIALLVGVLFDLLYITVSLMDEKQYTILKGKNEEDYSLKELIRIPFKRVENELEINDILSGDNDDIHMNRAFRKLRANLQFININCDDKKTFLITSPLRGEGKTFVSLNLANSYAEIGKKVIVIDGNLNNGKIDKIFNVEGTLGVSNFLSGLDNNGGDINKKIKEYILSSNISGIDIIPSGVVPPNSTELLSSKNLSSMIKSLGKDYDIIIIDGPEVLKKADALIITRNVGTTILVADIKYTRYEDLLQAKNDIQNVSGRVVGVTINKDRSGIKGGKNPFKSIGGFFKKHIDNFKGYLEYKRRLRDRKLIEEPKDIDKEEPSEKDIASVENYAQYKLDVNADAGADTNTENDTDAEADVRAGSDTDIDIDVDDDEDQEIEPMIIPEVEENVEAEQEEKEIESKIELESIETEKENEIVEELENEVVEPEKLEKETDVEIETEQEKELVTETEEDEAYEIEEAETEEIIEEEIEEQKSSAKDDPYFTDEKIKKIQKYMNNFEKNHSIKGKAAGFAGLFGSFSNFITNTKNSIVDKTNSWKNNKNKKAREEKKIESQNETYVANDVPEDSFVEPSSDDIIDDGLIEELPSRDIPKFSDDDEVQEEENNNILVIIDSRNGYARAFNKDCYTEKLIRGLDREDGFLKAYYSPANDSKRIEMMVTKYGITKAQAKRIDPLVFAVLSDFDEKMWIYKNIALNTAELYVYIMAQDYARETKEPKAAFEKRCKELRKQELLDNCIEIEYSLNFANESGEVTFMDRLMMNKYANIYGNTTKEILNTSVDEILDASNISKENFEKMYDEKEYFEMANESMNLLSEQISTTDSLDDKKKIEILEKDNIDEMNKIMDERKKEVDALRRISRLEQDAIIAKKNFEESVAEYNEIREDTDVDIYKTNLYNSSNQSNSIGDLAKREEEALLRREKRQEQQLLKKIKKEKKLLKKEEERKKKDKEKKKRSSKKEEEKKIREFQRAQEKEEARIEEELLENNLYPKTKNIKDL